MRKETRDIPSSSPSAIAPHSQSQRHLAFLWKAGTALDSSLDYETTLSSVVQLAVPQIADWCAADLVQTDGTLKRLAVAHVDPAQVETAIELQRRYPTDPNSTRGVPQVIRSGKSEIYPAVSEALLEEVASDAGHLALLREIGFKSFIAVPMVARGRTIGALTFVSQQADHLFDNEDLALAEDLGRRAALAVDNARLYQEAQQLNAQLEQRVAERTAQLEAATAEAQTAKAEANRANHAKSDFLSRMSHELRTPLNAILGFAQLLEMDDLSPQQKVNLRHILKGGRHLLDLINEVLDIARIESGRMQLSPEPVAVCAIIRESLDLIRPLAAARHIEIHETCDQVLDQNIFVQADRQRLKQVLLNLLGNAVKYNHDGGSVRVEGELAPDNCLRILVHDTGPGIAAEKMERLFVPFDRLDAEQTRIEGTGLGLALSQRLTEAMNGKMGVQSTLGEGSAFWIDLPVVDGPHAGHESSDSTLTEIENGYQEHKLLYVEDNLSNLKLVEAILQRRPGIRLISAMQGSLGLELACEHGPDLILLDLHLPDISGYDVLMRLRAKPSTHNIPVVMLSADATPGQIARLLSAGADGYLTKPLDVRKFLEAVDKTLQKVKVEDVQSVGG